MARWTATRAWYESPCPLEVEFCLDGTSVRSVAEIPTAVQEESPAYGFVEILSVVEIEDFDGAHEAPRYARPSTLKALGVLSFLSGYCWTVYQAVSTETAVLDVFEPPSAPSTKFLCEDLDLAPDLDRLLGHMAGDESPLLASLIDRWRRALYLVDESEAGLHEEEAFLGFFHVLELLVVEYEPRQREAARTRLVDYVRATLEDDLLLRGVGLDEQLRSKSKALEELLLGPGALSITSRILFMLREMGLEDLRTHRLIPELVHLRNSVAHGRVSYRDALIWPLPPHFPILSQHTRLANVIPVFAARLISQHYGLDRWVNEWDSLAGFLHPPMDVVKAFVANGECARIGRIEFENGEVDFVRPGSIADAALLKKIKMPQLEQSLGDYLEATDSNADLEDDVAYAVVLLCDASDSAVAQSCQSLYLALPLDTFGVTNEKDILRVLEDLGHQPAWLRTHLDRKASA